ncbi:hypothetical protein Trydic_g16560 [Trypoxylus dichotomus]
MGKRRQARRRKAWKGRVERIKLKRGKTLDEISKYFYVAVIGLSSLIIYFEQERNKNGTLLLLTAVRQRVAAAANMSIWAVSKISNSAKSLQALPSCSNSRNKLKPIVDIDEASEAAIHDVIYQMYHNPMLKCILHNQERDLFSGGDSSLGKVSRNIGFTWKKDDP